MRREKKGERGEKKAGGGKGREGKKKEGGRKRKR